MQLTLSSKYLCNTNIAIDVPGAGLERNHHPGREKVRKKYNSIHLFAMMMTHDDDTFLLSFSPPSACLYMYTPTSLYCFRHLEPKCYIIIVHATQKYETTCATAAVCIIEKSLVPTPKRLRTSDDVQNRERSEENDRQRTFG